MEDKISVPAKHKKGVKKHYKCAVLTISTSKYWKRENGEKEIDDWEWQLEKFQVIFEELYLKKEEKNA